MIPTEIFENKLHQIDEKLKVWNYNTLNGRGLCKTTEKYAHIEIEISNRKDENELIIWNITEKQIPSKYYDYKPYVKETIEFFIDYLNSLKGEKTNLTFEINDGSYHPVDTHDRLYAFATLNAIINCFDKEIEKFDENWVEYIKRLVDKMDK